MAAIPELSEAFEVEIIPKVPLSGPIDTIIEETKAATPGPQIKELPKAAVFAYLEQQFHISEEELQSAFGMIDYVDTMKIRIPSFNPNPESPICAEVRYEKATVKAGKLFSGKYLYLVDSQGVHNPFDNGKGMNRTQNYMFSYLIMKFLEKNRGLKLTPENNQEIRKEIRGTDHLQDRVSGIFRTLVTDKAWEEHGGKFDSALGVMRLHELMAQIGEYGEKLALALIKAGRALQKRIKETMASDCQRFNESERTLLDITFKRDSSGTLQEAIETFVATYSVLTSHQVPGFENNPEALLKLIRTNSLALMLPMGLIVPMNRAGIHFQHPLVHHDGMVDISPSLKKLLTREKSHRNHLHTKKNYSKEKSETGAGCPVAKKLETILKEGTGLEMLERVFVQCVLEALKS